MGVPGPRGGAARCRQVAAAAPRGGSRGALAPAPPPPTRPTRTGHKKEFVKKNQKKRAQVG
eukprot:4166764-Pyramimonas_sp.AAC.1